MALQPGHISFRALCECWLIAAHMDLRSIALQMAEWAQVSPQGACDGAAASSYFYEYWPAMEMTASWLHSEAPGSVLAEQVCGDGHGQVGDVVVPQISASLSVRCLSEV